MFLLNLDNRKPPRKQIERANNIFFKIPYEVTLSPSLDYSIVRRGYTNKSREKCSNL
jgi:hypothetical protein